MPATCRYSAIGVTCRLLATACMVTAASPWSSASRRAAARIVARLICAARPISLLPLAIKVYIVCLHHILIWRLLCAFCSATARAWPARQCATLLSQAGHRVEAPCAEGLCLGRLTRHVRRVHRVPAFGADPFGWLDAAMEVAARRHAEVLLPVQEQVAVCRLRRAAADAGLRTAVPDFGALAGVQDKVSAFGTLTRPACRSLRPWWPLAGRNSGRPGRSPCS